MCEWLCNTWSHCIICLTPPASPLLPQPPSCTFTHRVSPLPTPSPQVAYLQQDCDDALVKMGTMMHQAATGAAGRAEDGSQQEGVAGTPQKRKKGAAGAPLAAGGDAEDGGGALDGGFDDDGLPQGYWIATDEEIFGSQPTTVRQIIN